MQDFAYWSSWALSYFSTLSFPIIICAVISLYPFNKASFREFVVLLVLVAVALSSLAYCMSTLVSRYRVACISTALLYPGLYGPRVSRFLYFSAPSSPCYPSNQCTLVLTKNTVQLLQSSSANATESWLDIGGYTYLIYSFLSRRRQWHTKSTPENKLTLIQCFSTLCACMGEEISDFVSS